MIRVALVNLKPKLRDILADAVGRERDMHVISCGAGPAADIARARPDVVVCEVADPVDQEAPEQLLRSAPRARVLMIAETGDRAALYELRPTQKILINVSMNQVIDAIRFGLAQRSH